MREGATLSSSNTSGFKRKYCQAIVLFHLGDFYETFDEDARISSRELEIVLTSREMGRGHRVPMGGHPISCPG